MHPEDLVSHPSEGVNKTDTVENTATSIPKDDAQTANSNRYITDVCSDKCSCHVEEQNEEKTLVCIKPNNLDRFPLLNDSSLMGNITVM